MINFWAKTDRNGSPGISAYGHMLNVGHVARCIAAISPNLLARFHLRAQDAATLAALHDLGKISPGFQRKCSAWLAENGLEKIARNGCWDTAMESDHGKISHAAIQAFLVERGIGRGPAKFVATILGGHHGRLNPPNDRGYRPPKPMSDSASQINWDAERSANARMVWEHFGGCNFSTPFDDESPSLWWLAGLTSVADWIGSDERFFSPARPTGKEDVSSLAQTALQTIGFLPPALKPGLSFNEIFGFPPNEMQEKAIGAITGPGVYVIDAPMGLGKTEAALGAAYNLMVSEKANGVYFALPTQATSNRMHLRMNEFLEHISPGTGASRLIHGNSWLMETHDSMVPSQTALDEAVAEDARTGRDWFASPKRALLAPFGVGTIDQALLGVVAAKHFFVRHFALAGKVVILDEVHSYDLYTGTLIGKLITTLEGLGCTVIVLSATLTGRRRRQIAASPGDALYDEEQPYPLITGRREEEHFTPVAASPPESKTVHVDFITVESADSEAIQLARNGGTVLWICNTVDAAQEQYRRLAELAREEFPVGLLHSRFPFWRRNELEAEWMERLGKDSKNRCGSILVATQVVEQSVDLDADLLITELAPTDMLLQRLGRLWRHERGKRLTDKARMLIINEGKNLEIFRNAEAKEIVESLGSKAKVYAPFVLLRSLEVWKALPEVSIPRQIRWLLESTYREREEEPASWQQLADDWLGTDSAKKMLAQRNSNLWQVTLEDEEGVQTRLNEIPTVSLVLCRSLTKHEVIFIDQSKGCIGDDQYRLDTARAIHKNLVKVPKYCYARVEICPAFTGYLHGEQCAGIVAEDGTVTVQGLRKGIQFSYSEALGLLIEKTNSKEGI